MMRAVIMLGAVALCSAWTQMGSKIHSNNVTALSLDFDPDGFPAFAYGYNVSAGRTNIPIQAWDGTEWVRETERVSQFQQGYHEFIFKVRNGIKYVGLKIHYRYGSVLNGAVAYRGSYAFHNQLFGFEIDGAGDMMMLWISESATTSSYPGTDNHLAIVKYPASGWTSYPAADHFEKQVVVAEQTDTKRVTDVKMVRGPTADSFYGAYVLGNEVSVFNDTKTFKPLGTPFPGFGMSIAYSTKYGLAVASFSTTEMAVNVHVLSTDGQEWVHLGAPITHISERLDKTHVGITSNGVVVVGCLGASPDVLEVATYSLEMPSGWSSNNVKAADPITHWELGVQGTNAYVVISENANGVRTLQTVIS
eukprot:TRINITY_DN57_c0_g1_i10.p1 TRINITY_DN57_c0_g1~~TRINITY_DN57_c0_g1_i10.p1  ORF type:complete len:363 (+),score=124.04 TRINITY_DN57_c0_g1_i10:58-1146(+)